MKKRLKSTVLGWAILLLSTLSSTYANSQSIWASVEDIDSLKKSELLKKLEKKYLTKTMKSTGIF